MKKFLILLTVLGAFCAACFLNSCNVTRTMTNESSYLQRGDTSVMIQTKTIERYDAKNTSCTEGLRIASPIEVRLLYHLDYRESHPDYNDLLNKMSAGRNKSQKLAIFAQHYQELKQRKFPALVKNEEK